MKIDLTVTMEAQFLEALARSITGQWLPEGGDTVLNDMYYVTRGAAPLDTGNLENSITHIGKKSGEEYTGEIGVTAIAPHNGFDYGTLRHDYPFNLGPGSQAKGGTTSPLTGNSYSVGYGFAANTEQGAEGYFDYLERLLRQIISQYTV